MKLIQPGNTKLGKHTYMFNLPASESICGRTCKSCYAIREQQRFPSIRLARESRYHSSLSPSFASQIISEISSLRTKPSFFRIHASGEFHSQSYIDSWHTIASAFPSITFYAYTKRLSHFDFSALQSLPNFVLINSLHFGSLNYGKSPPSNTFVCPTGTDSSIQCGLNCTWCMTKGQADIHGVYFLQH